MSKTSAFYTEGAGTVSLWLSADTAEDRRLITRIINCIADEINDRIRMDNWNFDNLAESGAIIMNFRDKAQKAEEDMEDEAV